MLSSKTNILQLVSLMLKKGISDVVVCPGSRNAPLLHTFASVGMNCYEVTDERSAGFFAIGLIEGKGRPAAVCCTSGSAVLNLAPAVAEAYYRPLPLLVITADRPEQWIGQMDGQTMPQLAAFGQTIRKAVSLPESDAPSWHANRLVNEALLAMERTKGPVHINVPLSEPLFDFSASELPEERAIDVCGREACSVSLASEHLRQWTCARRPMIIVGQMLPKDARVIAGALKSLSSSCIVLAEELSNLPAGSIACRYFDRVISANPDSERLRPDFVLTIGGHIVSKHLKQWLRTNQPQHHWSVSPTGEVADLFQCMSALWECEAADILSALSAHLPANADSEYLSEWHEMAEKTPMKSGNDGQEVLGKALQMVSAEWNVHVANSSMVRDMQNLPSSGCEVYCNRGINGIEGCVSAAAGLAAGSGKDTLLLTGDLSFFYDKNGLWNNYAKGALLPGGGRMHLAVLLLNNGGGRIFKSIMGMESSQYRDTMISGAHHTTAEGVAQECGAAYRALPLAEVEDADIAWLLDEWTDGSSCVRILEVEI